MTDKHRYDASRDPELAELLADEPELFVLAAAIADVAETGSVKQRSGARETRVRRGRRSRLALVAAPVVVLVLALSLVVALAPWRAEIANAGVVEEARDALGDGPVIHLASSKRLSGEGVVDIETGAQVTDRIGFDVWYDEEQNVLHTIVIRGGSIVSEFYEDASGIISDAGSDTNEAREVMVPPALVRLARDYRAALLAGSASLLGVGVIHGRELYVLELDSDDEETERVFIDSTTYLPVYARSFTRDGDPSPFVNVERIEAVTRAHANLAPPSPRLPGPSETSFTHARGISPARAAKVLGAGGYWLAESFQGLELAVLQQVRITNMYPAGSGLERDIALGLELVYGAARGTNPDRASGEPFIWIRESRRPEMGYGWSDLVLPPAGAMRLAHWPDTMSWRGHLLIDGVYVVIEATSRGLLLEAARALQPLS